MFQVGGVACHAWLHAEESFCRVPIQALCGKNPLWKAFRVGRRQICRSEHQQQGMMEWCLTLDQASLRHNALC